ncbi:MAG: SGNH/GDSL hydrolase family protein [Gemmataceae bacterium]|nr:SGNH/GDSL hydrolase family protein [Gemmataceae bacterium]
MWIRFDLCLLVFLLAAGQGDAQDAKPGKVRILLLGDSTVIGTFCRDLYPKADHLEDVVRKLLATEPDLAPVEVLNRGVNGDMVSLLLARPRRYESDVVKQPPLDFIFLRYGLNDIRHVKDFKTEFPASYKKLIARLRADQPKAEIVLETVIPFFSDERNRTINDHVRAVAAAEKLPVLDQHGPYAAGLTKGPNMLFWRRLPLKDVPVKYHALIPPESICGDVVHVGDNLLDVHLAKVPDWFKDRHPNLAGYQVLGTQLAGYLALRLREKAKVEKIQKSTPATPK